MDSPPWHICCDSKLCVANRRGGRAARGEQKQKQVIMKRACEGVKRRFVSAAPVRVGCFSSSLAVWGHICELPFLCCWFGRLSVLECAFWVFLVLLALLHLLPRLRLFVTHPWFGSWCASTRACGGRCKPTSLRKPFFLICVSSGCPTQSSHCFWVPDYHDPRGSSWGASCFAYRDASPSNGLCAP